jgi:hypothetical protein
VVADQNDEVVVEATEEEQWQANPRYKTTTNTPTKRTLAMADGKTLLNGKALRILAVLRMNRSFMVLMRENCFLEIEAPQPFNVTSVVPDIEEVEGES